MIHKNKQNQVNTLNEHYSHFKKVLKTRQKFPTSTSQHTSTRTPKSPQQKITQFFQVPGSREKIIPLSKQPQQPQFYSLSTLPYKNYKYEKPPGNSTVADFLEQAYRNGLKSGRWDRKSLIEQYNNVPIKRSIYTSNHLIKSRKVQGPASCLETIYVAKLQLDLEDNQNEELQQKVIQLEETLREGVKNDRTKCDSQQYILNRWTRTAVSQERQCAKTERLPQFAHQKYIINQSINKVAKSSSHYTTQESITQLPERISFFKFDQRQKSFQKQLYYNRGQTLQLLKQNYPFLNKSIIGDRVLLSFEIFEFTEQIPYKTFCTFIQVYDNKKAKDIITLNIIISQIIKFFMLDDDITTAEFCNLVRILCQQMNDNHPTIKPIYQQLISNYKFYNIIGEDLQQSFNKTQFKFIYSTNEMNIDDIIDLITLM